MIQKQIISLVVIKQKSFYQALALIFNVITFIVNKLFNLYFFSYDKISHMEANQILTD